MSRGRANAAKPPWLLLIHQVPPSPDYLRVKVRRRLTKLGATPLKNSVYLLPNTEAALEDFQWLAQEIRTDGGEAAVAEVSFVAGLTNADVEALVRGGSVRQAPAAKHASRPRGLAWVTRIGVGIDRIASAWLIRTFIDPKAKLKFVPARGYRPKKGEQRFDMFDGEYTHVGDQCTFEVLLAHFGPAKDRALASIAQIVHDIDCKDSKFQRPEAAGVARLIDAIATSSPDDATRVERGSTLFADLYRSFSSSASPGQGRRPVGSGVRRSRPTA